MSALAGLNTLGQAGAAYGDVRADSQKQKFEADKATQERALRIQEFLQRQKMDQLTTQVQQSLMDERKTVMAGSWEPIGNPMQRQDGTYSIIERNSRNGEIRVKPLPADLAPENEDQLKWQQYSKAYKTAFGGEPDDNIRKAFFNKLAGVPNPKEGEFEAWRAAFKESKGREPNAAEIEHWHRQPKEGQAGGSALDSMAQAVADKSTRLPAGKLGVEVLNRMKEMGLKLPNQLNPAAEDKLMQRVSGLQNTIDIIDRIKPDLDLLQSLPKASLVQLAESPKSVESVLTRYGGLFEKPADKMRIEQLAGNLVSLKEAINVIRGPLGATGFRGKEGWDALQLQTVRALTAPGINKQVLDNTEGLLKKLLTNTQQILGTDDSAAPAANNDPGGIR